MSMSKTTRDDVAIWLGLVLVGTVPLTTNFILVLRHFYVLGGFWSDSGAIASLLWHNNWQLELLSVNTPLPFWQIHISPIFVPITWISWVVPLSEIQYFALFCGISFAMTAVAVYWLLVTSYQMRQGWTLLGAIFVSLLFAYNGMALASARNPHFEMFIIGAGMLFLVALVRKNYHLATLFFCLCIMTREDAGLHVAAMLVIFLAIQKMQAVPLRRHAAIIWFILSGVFYSFTVIALQKYFSDGYNVMGHVYLGSPPFSHVTWRGILDHIDFYIVARRYVFLPVFFTLFWAARRQNLVIAAGYISVLPWTLLSLLAFSPWAYTLSGYYCFPFIFAMFWPLVGLQLAVPEDSTPKAPWRPALVFGAILLSSLTNIPAQANPGHIDFPASFFLAPSLQWQHQTDATLQDFISHKAMFGQIAVDSGVAALDPADYLPSQLLESPATATADTIIYFLTSYQIAIINNAIKQNGLNFSYQFPGTALRVASRRQVAGVAGLVATPH